MISKCRSCNSSNLKKLMSLGDIYFTGKFPKKTQTVPKGRLELLLCNRCKLTQLSNNFSTKYMYNKDYGYQSGINEAMVSHLKNILKTIQKYKKLKKDDIVLDIASNDGTLLNLYKNKNIKTFGIDPIIGKFKKNYKNITYKSIGFFDQKKYFSKTKQKAKVITCISMFYDLQNPNKFLKDIKKVLDINGIFILEQSDILKMIEANAFDTICHEHLEYYSIKSLRYLIISNKLKIIFHEYNNANGGSSRFIICHDENENFKEYENLNSLIRREDSKGINNGTAIKQMYKKIFTIKHKLRLIMEKIKKKNLVIHGYGASTKGNTLLQFFDLSKYIDFISDRNVDKVGKYTPDKKIKIISEKESRNLNPDYYFVLPWHFKYSLVDRERRHFKVNAKFIFPLPKIEII